MEKLGKVKPALRNVLSFNPSISKLRLERVRLET